MKTNLDKLLILLRTSPDDDSDYGGTQALATICGVDKALISRDWKRKGRVPVKYNHRIKAHIAGSSRSDAWKEAAVACLEPDVCPTCGQGLFGRVI